MSFTEIELKKASPFKAQASRVGMPAPSACGRGSIEVSRRRTNEFQPFTYAQLDQMQRELAEAGQYRLILSELSPVITLGKRASLSSLLLPRERYITQGIDVYQTDRGGLATYHGPGQWVLFPIFSVEALVGRRAGIRALVEGLLQVACSTAQHFGVQSEIRQGCEAGVWVGECKLASVGIRVRQGVIYHGLSFNVNKTSESFFGIHPCGLKSKLDPTQGVQPAYLSDYASGIEFESVGDCLIRQFGLQFNLDTQPTRL